MLAQSTAGAVLLVSMPQLTEKPTRFSAKRKRETNQVRPRTERGAGQKSPALAGRQASLWASRQGLGLD